VGHDRRQGIPKLPGFRVRAIGVFAKTGDDQLAFSSERRGEPVDVFGMPANCYQIE
jgi:hypothetical protein